MGPKKWTEDEFSSGGIPERYRVCSCCRYWLYDYKTPVYALVDSKTRIMGQCIAAEDHPRGPFVEMDKGESAHFTTEDGLCSNNAFVPTAEAMAEWKDETADTTHDDLDDGLVRDAWLR